MNKKSQVTLWIFLSVAILLAITWQFYPLPDAKKRMDNFPLYGPAFSGKKLQLSVFEKDFFKNVNIVKRLYDVEGVNYFVTVLDGTHDRHAIHDPYYCFKGGGWEIISAKEVEVPGGNAMLVHMKKDGKTIEAIYWFSNGKEHYSSALTYWIQATLRRLTLGLSGPEPVLITIQPINSDKIQLNFLEKEFPEIFHL
jgi:Protein of unknown function (DUF3485)